jgi:hypothetical protein
MNPNNQPNLVRRKALIGGTAGVAAATAWHTPILKSVVLPAHAQMSVASPAAFFGSVSTALVVKNSSPWDLLVQPANAGVEPISETVYTVVIARLGEPGGMYEVGVHARTSSVLDQDDVFEAVEVVYKGTVTLGAGKALEVDQNPCLIKLQSFVVEVDADNGDSIDVSFVGLTLNVPQAEGSLPDAECVFAIADNYYTPSAQEAGDQANRSKLEFSPLDLLVSPAHADQELSDGFAVERVGSTLNVTHRNYDGNVSRYGSMSIFSGEGTLAQLANPCGIRNGLVKSIDMELESINATQMVLTLYFGGERGTTSFIIPASDIGSLALEAICES